MASILTIPTELLTEIVKYLSRTDQYRLRLQSHAFNTLLNALLFNDSASYEFVHKQNSPLRTHRILSEVKINFNHRENPTFELDNPLLDYCNIPFCRPPLEKATFFLHYGKALWVADEYTPSFMIDKSGYEDAVITVHDVLEGVQMWVNGDSGDGYAKVMNPDFLTMGTALWGKKKVDGRSTLKNCSIINSGRRVFRGLGWGGNEEAFELKFLPRR